MTGQSFSCETCGNKDDCDEYESQAARDVSERCGLACHSSLVSNTLVIMELTRIEMTLDRIEVRLARNLA